MMEANNKTSTLRQMIGCIAIWFILMLPFSPSVWRVCAMGPACFTSAWIGTDPLTCLAGFAFVAPFAVVFGPLGHDSELGPSELPEVLGTALLLAITIVGARITFRKFKSL
jgi:hypothetical protein